MIDLYFIRNREKKNLRTIYSINEMKLACVFWIEPINRTLTTFEIPHSIVLLFCMFLLLLLRGLLLLNLTLWISSFCLCQARHTLLFAICAHVIYLKVLSVVLFLFLYECWLWVREYMSMNARRKKNCIHTVNIHGAHLIAKCRLASYSHCWRPI